jgi:short-subunit dehydrogenase involved in D-alanine esterification of teichoic acids
VDATLDRKSLAKFIEFRNMKDMIVGGDQPRYCIMKNCVRRYHIALQLELKNHSNIIVLQLGPPKCNSYATTFYKYGDLINKIPHQKIS